MVSVDWASGGQDASALAGGNRVHRGTPDRTPVIFRPLHQLGSAAAAADGHQRNVARRRGLERAGLGFGFRPTGRATGDEGSLATPTPHGRVRHETATIAGLNRIAKAPVARPRMRACDVAYRLDQKRGEDALGSRARCTGRAALFNHAVRQASSFSLKEQAQ